MRALFYLLDGDTNASSRLRALQYFPLLRDCGIQAAASRPVPQPLYQRLMEGASRGLPRKAAFYGLFLASRLVDVLRGGLYDVVVIQRDLFPFGPPTLERLLRHVNSHLVYDTDDATYLRPSFTPDTVFQRLRRFDKVAEVVRHARWVTVATEPIARWVRRHNECVTVVPMAVDLAQYDAARARRSPRSAGTPLVVGWAGTAGGLRYLDQLAPVLRELASRYAFEVRVISGGYRQVRLPGVPFGARPWHAESELDDIAGFDIGLVPLENNPFEAAKFPSKMLQYLASGVSAVCSRVGATTDVIRDGENGFLASTPDEWREKLEHLLSDATLRRQLAAAGRETVAERFTIQSVAPLLADAIRRAA